MCILIVTVVFDDPRFKYTHPAYNVHKLKRTMRQLFSHTKQLMINNEIYIMREDMEQRYGVLAEIISIVSDINASIKIRKIWCLRLQLACNCNALYTVITLLSIFWWTIDLFEMNNYGEISILCKRCYKYQVIMIKLKGKNFSRKCLQCNEILHFQPAKIAQLAPVLSKDSFGTRWIAQLDTSHL